MQLTLLALDPHLAKTFAPLYVISSDEPLLASEAADKIRGRARDRTFNEREVLSVERGFQWSNWRLAQQTQSLLGDKKLIELHLPTGKPGKDGALALQDHVAYLDSLPDHQRSAPPLTDTLTTVTLIHCPKLDWATQKTAWYAALTRSKNTVVIDIPVIERAQLPNWIGTRLAAQQQHAEPASLRLMADRVEGNLLAAHQEIQKLGLLYPPGPLSVEEVDSAVQQLARYDVFQLGEAMLSGDIPRFVRMLEGLKGEGVALPLVLWAMAEECRTLLKLSTGLAQGQSRGQLMKDCRIWGPRERWITAALQRLSQDCLRAALQEAAQIDRLIKGLKTDTHGGDPWDALLQLGRMLQRACEN